VSFLPRTCFICRKEFLPRKSTQVCCSKKCGDRKKGDGRKGVPRSPEVRAKISKSNMGRKYSPETLAKMSLAKKGKPGSFKGKKHTLESKKKNAEAHRAEKSSFWRGGTTALDRIIRKCFLYREWRKSVFTRDRFTCQWCGATKKYLQAHHIKQFALLLRENGIKSVEEAENCQELWDTNNGITLCLDCHKETDTYFNKGANI